MTYLLEVRNLKKYYPVRSGLMGQVSSQVMAVDGVSLHVAKGETLSLVGESGCGKSTVGRAILRLFDLTEGEVLLDGRRIDTLSERELRPLRRDLQVVFQDPFASLNPRRTVRQHLTEPIRNFEPRIAKDECESRVQQLLALVRLPADAADRLPHEFSGGQRQRICIARALASKPQVIICDEAVSALDVSVKAQVVNLLQDLQKELGLGLLFISHDLAIVEHMTHRVAVMYFGRIVEQGDAGSVFGSPQHPYTHALLSAAPDREPGAERIVLNGDLPSPMNPPSGCHFHARCPYAFDRCKSESPALTERAPGHFAACHLQMFSDGNTVS
ncbi:ABC transporter ATP-binding protein [Burkholderia pseudomultivorans]|uniref:Dipeptide transporter ATP-binding subunit n=1 Tax=Burkholderia pseudomultivorans TaxID=1207504 RepID=A0A6P2MQA2_9BURK|nr:oligopeptide/dipeptide ABC transporter ATP-binding protein [Burkholderia pseudomultivorans]MDR8730110.1 Glutathione import ATP-binding protein GsiA [Burkholderia pseudomultivorans]MDR8734695.1 Glutathione import ATP-binding protein GsiA [Burkholderia pseudomultivorans]MDR8740661.1 Glutathione import ATP-binding protein GsiA [Burkholderia pseudomultivorans]MDR8751674.1 Glutathione import ATP-binding protein GsiA [Burkholderia pseudomultivorans]MDR8777075.1 Glutathione import ATP-binding prot